ncbi:MAG: hypothetical protein AVDCRST_MAG78-1602, partial [uncultured Rubrobacteraceae bacterium]
GQEVAKRRLTGGPGGRAGSHPARRRLRTLQAQERRIYADEELARLLLGQAERR